MSSTYATSQSTTFTVTHARYLASKVKTDLYRLHSYYREPSLEDIDKYEQELILLLKEDYLDEISYGFQEDGEWVIAVMYKASQGGVITTDDDPGGLRYREKPEGAQFTSMLFYNKNWRNATESQKNSFRRESPIQRVSGTEPNGNWEQQHAYSAGGRGIVRYGI